MKYTIAALVPVYNEEHNLPRCLKALTSWCDEVVVLDMGSTDRSKEVARAHGATVTRWEKPADSPFIAIQKAINEAAGRNTCQWVFRVDADEVVTPQLQKEIEDILNKGDKAPYQAYGVPRLPYFWGGFLKGGDWAYDRLVRLYRPGAARYTELSSVHEQLVVSAPIGYLKGALEHYSHPTLAVAVNKFNRYTTIEAQHITATKGKAYWNMLALPPYIFVRWMLWHHGWRDGVRGVVAGTMRAWYEFILWAKYLEQKSVSI